MQRASKHTDLTCPGKTNRILFQNQFWPFTFPFAQNGLIVIVSLVCWNFLCKKKIETLHLNWWAWNQTRNQYNSTDLFSNFWLFADPSIQTDRHTTNLSPPPQNAQRNNLVCDQEELSPFQNCMHNSKEKDVWKTAFSRYQPCNFNTGNKQIGFFLHHIHVLNFFRICTMAKESMLPRTSTSFGCVRTSEDFQQRNLIEITFLQPEKCFSWVPN